MIPVYRPFGLYRLGLAVLVLLSHSLWMSAGGDSFLARVGLGNVGVMSFFVLSGFIVSEALATFYAGRSGAFLVNRFNRLYPPFVAALAVSIALHALAGVGVFSARNLIGNALALIPFAQNNAMGTLPAYDFIPIVWAVRAEVMFYVAAGAAAFLGWTGFGTVAFVVLLLQLATYAWQLPYNLSFYGQFAPYFVLGVAFHRRHRVVAGVALVATLAHYAVYVSAGASSAPAVVSFGLFCLSLGIFARLSGRQSRHVDLDRRFGDMSYPVYLVHSGVIVLVSLVATGYLAHAAAIGLTLLIAVALIAAVEAPMRSVRARVRRAAL